VRSVLIDLTRGMAALLRVPIFTRYVPSPSPLLCLLAGHNGGTPCGWRGLPWARRRTRRTGARLRSSITRTPPLLRALYLTLTPRQHPHSSPRRARRIARKKEGTVVPHHPMRPATRCRTLLTPPTRAFTSMLHRYTSDGRLERQSAMEAVEAALVQVCPTTCYEPARALTHSPTSLSRPHWCHPTQPPPPLPMCAVHAGRGIGACPGGVVAVESRLTVQGRW
jgi:hypothetical protein